MRIRCTAGNWGVHVIDFARCLLSDANRQIPPTFPGWHVGESNLIEGERGPVLLLDDTARFHMRISGPCWHRQVPCLERPQRPRIGTLVFQNDYQTATEPACLTVHGELRTHSAVANQLDRKERSLSRIDQTARHRASSSPLRQLGRFQNVSIVVKPKCRLLCPALVHLTRDHRGPN